MKNNFWEKINKPILALAPMAGITDSAFRQICKLSGADVVYSEMASVSALFFKPQKTLELVKFDKKENPYVVQLFGNNPEHFSVATQIITQKIKPAGIDINFGCPARKVFKHGSGCALMLQKELAREIIKNVLAHTNLPVSLKIRAGLKDTDALEFIQNIQDLPYSALMVHGRTYEEKFSGPVNFQLIEKIKQVIPNKIILANGGINSPEDASKILKIYPLIDGLGIARGALGKPYLFQQIKDFLSTGVYEKYDFEKIKKIIFQHAEIIKTTKSTSGILEIRKHLVWYLKGFAGASQLRKKLVRAESLKEIKTILKEGLSTDLVNLK